MGGHDFSRAVTKGETQRALAPEALKLGPQRLKPFFKSRAVFGTTEVVPSLPKSEKSEKRILSLAGLESNTGRAGDHIGSPLPDDGFFRGFLVTGVTADLADQEMEANQGRSAFIRVIRVPSFPCT